MVRVKGSFSAGGPKIKAPQYHAIISRMLQKQFVHSCTCSLVICYMCSFIFGSRKDFWSLFPWTWTGFRTLIIFAAIFPLYLNRKINLHGKQNHLERLEYSSLGAACSQNDSRTGTSRQHDGDCCLPTILRQSFAECNCIQSLSCHPMPDISEQLQLRTSDGHPGDSQVRLPSLHFESD